MLSAWLRLPAKLYDRVRMAQHLIEAQPLLSPPEWEKHEYIRRWAAATGCRIFIETGTYRGDTTLAVADAFDRALTIEADEGLHRLALERFRGLPNVTALHGDSGDVLARVIAEVSQPALFFLDAHTFHSTPVLRELEAIFAHPVKRHVVLVDDARYFIGRRTFPSVRQLAAFVRRKSDYSFRMARDMIFIYPEIKVLV
jgi:predicted O-methyltransferase YrrM